MEEEVPSRRSVSELAGKFKDSARPHDAAGNETEKPVRRRPPRSLTLPKTHRDEQEQPPGVTSPLPSKAKRNSALIEKLQANLALSPSALLPSPKSPGFRLLPPAFTLPSPGSAPVATVTTTPPPASPISVSPWTEEEGPTSFEAPPTVAEGSILSNANVKARARHSIRRRPPSRRHRKSSSGEEVGMTTDGEDAYLSSPTEPGDKTEGGGGEETEGGGGRGGGEEGETNEVNEDKTDALTCPKKNSSHEEKESKISVETGGVDEEKKEGDQSSSGKKEAEEEAAQREHSKEEDKNEETASQSSAR